MIELFKSQVSSAILEMEWSAKCDCESSVKFSSKPGESPKKMELTDRETVEDGGELDAISFNLSGGSGVYGSDAGQVFSTKGSISTSSGSSPGDFKKKMEPLISLKLGKRTYFGNSHVQSSSSIARVSKRTKPSSQGPQIPRCQVEGCNLDLSSAKQYHKKHRVCDKHSKCPKVIVGGVERRFCQQCSRFHSLSEFDEKKRSCRRRLSDHNARRRNLTKLPSSCYDDGIQMNFVLNQVPLVHSKASANSSQDPHSSKFTITEEFTSEPEKTTGINKQPYISGIQLPNATAMHNNAWNWPLTTSKGTFAEIFNQGAKVPALPSNVCTMQEFARALSLLSTPSQGSFEPISISNGNHVHANQSYFPEPVMHAIIPQGLPPLASSEYWAGFNQFPWTYPPGCQY